MQQTQTTRNTTTRETEPTVDPQVSDSSELLADSQTLLEDIDTILTETEQTGDKVLVDAARNQHTEVVVGQTSVRAWTLGGRVD